VTAEEFATAILRRSESSLMRTETMTIGTKDEFEDPYQASEQTAHPSRRRLARDPASADCHVKVGRNTPSRAKERSRSRVQPVAVPRLRVPAWRNYATVGTDGEGLRQLGNVARERIAYQFDGFVVKHPLGKCCSRWHIFRAASPRPVRLFETIVESTSKPLYG
jgi:hypothetical protein